MVVKCCLFCLGFLFIPSFLLPRAQRGWSKEFYVNQHWRWRRSVLVHCFLCLTNGHSHMNRTYCPQEPSGLSGCSSLHLVAWVFAKELKMTTKADRKSEDAQKDDSGREVIGTEINERKDDTQAEWWIKQDILVTWSPGCNITFLFLDFCAQTV